MVHWIFLEARLTTPMETFLYRYLPPPQEDFFSYLQLNQDLLHRHPGFDGIAHESQKEDLFFQGNLPSFISHVGEKKQTRLIRFGQPLTHPFFSLCQYWSPALSSEFSLFLEHQPSHFYVNLMKRRGKEGAMTQALERLEEEKPRLYVITLDKDSSFYWQRESSYPAEWESQSFKEAFLAHLCSPEGRYFWSKHLKSVEWRGTLARLIDQTHETYFRGNSRLNRRERQDLIELTYLAIIDHLVERWQPASMNMTCRQGMDRGPSLMVLWMMQKGLLEKPALAAWLLAPPLVTRNRSTHASRVERLLSAAERHFAKELTLRTAYGVNRRAAGNAEEAQRSFSSQKSETSELLQLLMSNQSSLRVCPAFSAALRLTPYPLRKVSKEKG